MSSRRWVWGALAVTLAATLWTALSDDDAAASRAASAARPARAGDAQAQVQTEARPEAGGAALVSSPAERGPVAADAGAAGSVVSGAVAQQSAVARERPAASVAAVDLFAAYSWQPPPPPPAPAGPPPKPMPPPLPYVYAGRVVDAGKTQYLLLEQSTLHSLATGAAVGDYVLESSSDTQLVFLHRPTGERQTLAIAPQASLP